MNQRCTILTSTDCAKESHVSSEQSRRTFLKLSAVGVTAAVAGDLSSGLANAVASPQPGEISVRVTSGNQHYSSGPALAWKNAGKASGSNIVVDPNRKFQEMLGFGAAFTDAACYMFNQLSPSSREELFHDLFHPSEMNLNVCRSCIG